MDSASEKRGQASAVSVADMFGADTIRTTRTHAKFALVGNDDWHVVITSSMNLNLNPRVEQFELTDDADRHAFFTRWVDEVFAELPAGGRRRDGDRQMPDTSGIEAVQPVLGIAVGTVTKVGRIFE